MLQMFLHRFPQGGGRFTVPPSGPCGMKASVASVRPTCHEGACYARVLTHNNPDSVHGFVQQWSYGNGFDPERSAYLGTDRTKDSSSTADPSPTASSLRIMAIGRGLYGRSQTNHAAFDHHLCECRVPFWTSGQHDGERTPNSLPGVATTPSVAFRCALDYRALPTGSYKCTSRREHHFLSLIEKSIESGLCRCLHCYQAQVAVSGDLPEPPHSDTIQRPLPLQPRESPFHSLPLSIDGSPAHRLDGSRYRFLMHRVRVDDRLGTILSPDEPPQRLAGIALVRDDSRRMKRSIGEPSLRKQVRRSLRIMDVTGRDVGRDGQLVFAVHHEVQLVTKLVLILTMRIRLDAPTSIRVGDPGLAWITPSLESRRVYCDSLSKPRQRLVVSAHKGTRDILKQGESGFLGELGKESTERTLMGDASQPVDSTGFGNEWIVLQSPNHCRRGRQPEVVFEDETPPNGTNTVALRPTSYRTNQLVNQGVIGERGKERFQLSDDRRRLNGRASGGRIDGDQREDTTFLFGSESTGVTASVFSSFTLVSVLRNTSNVNCRVRMFTTNLLPLLVIYRNASEPYVRSRNVGGPSRRDTSDLMVAPSAIYNAKDRLAMGGHLWEPVGLGLRS